MSSFLNPPPKGFPRSVFSRTQLHKNSVKGVQDSICPSEVLILGWKKFPELNNTTTANSVYLWTLCVETFGRHKHVRTTHTHTVANLGTRLKKFYFFCKKLRKSKIFNSASHKAEEKCFSRFRKENRKKVVHPFFFRGVEGGERKSHTDGGDVIIC